MNRTRLAATTTLLAVALPAATASAHVTLNPKSAAAGSFTELLVRVPTESDTLSTTKVTVKFPPGFVFASYEAQSGWTAKVTKSKLATPIKTDDGELTEQVDEITWTGSGSGVGKIAPGEFKDFPISVQIPGKAGDSLTFKALQTYSDKSVVRWIGAPEADKPAPVVAVTDAAADGHTMPTATPATPAAAVNASTEASGSSDSGDGLAIGALVVAIISLLVGGAAFVAGRKTA